MANRKTSTVTPTSPSDTGIQYVPLWKLVFDPELQMRVGELDQVHIQNLADILREETKAELTPLVAFTAAPDDPHWMEEDDDPIRYYVADGFHRGAGYRVARGDDCLVPVVTPGGGRAAALLYAYGANADQNTKPRTRKDIRKAVKEALRNHYFAATQDKVKFTKISLRPNGERFTHSHIAEICRCDRSAVTRIAKELEAELTPAAPAPTAGRGRPSGGGGGAGHEQLDFWARLRDGYSHALAAVRETRDDQEFLSAVDGDPLRAAEEIRAMRTALIDECRALREREMAIRASVAKAKR
ncbi:hypothetical protein H5P28_00215 [Ruficoccus amylovorans]|uniref:ParB/Sulfiredoxin domain-containing protein n=1 Tax=Ruficoccus amylovorans TaxID=1804625 RepID=A0A842H8X8_9BACT|nr:hypothetical protein [Ruficoccus amylovorans]MBC2592675.1 hypothetical protein [Ruficoccus amylovorans]